MANPVPPWIFLQRDIEAGPVPAGRPTESYQILLEAEAVRREVLKKAAKWLQILERRVTFDKGARRGWHC